MPNFDVNALKVDSVMAEDLDMDLNTQRFVTIESNGAVAILIPDNGPAGRKLAKILLEAMRTLRWKHATEALDGTHQETRGDRP